MEQERMFTVKPYSQDLRERVVRACDEGRLTRQAIADLFDVSTAWIRRLLQRRRETGSFAAKPPAGGPKPTLAANQRRQLVELVAQQPDATLAERKARLGAFVHLCTIHRALDRLGLTCKKKFSRRPNRTAPTSGTSGPSGWAGSPASTRPGWSSSTSAAPTQP
jgi:transposase